MARAITIVFGLLLLLPGACALGFMGLGVSMLPTVGSSEWNDVWPMAGLGLVLWSVCFAISFGGIMLIRRALRK
jgi:hypothetical protein